MKKMKTIEFDEKCKQCDGTGLFTGMGERDGAAIACHSCYGTGCYHFSHSYEEFTGRKPKPGIKRVYKTNPGIMIGEDHKKGLTLEDFGGLTKEQWESGVRFGPGTESRKFTCPAWWYQSADYNKKPKWQECRKASTFSACPYFKDKCQCWNRWDRENK